MDVIMKPKFYKVSFPFYVCTKFWNKNWSTKCLIKQQVMHRVTKGKHLVS